MITVKVFYPFYDNPTPEETAATEAAKAEADKLAKEKEGGDPKTFTQDEVNKMMVIERKKNEEKTKVLVKDLETIKKGKTLTDAEKTTLQAKIDELNSSLLTKEELTAKEKKALETKHKADLEAATKETETWRNRFTTTSILRTISDAAVEAQAFSASQITAILNPLTQLKEETDAEGNPTGKYVPRVAFPDTDKDGKEVTLDLKVSEAVKRMRETPEKYGNLFKDMSAGGTGSMPGNTPPGQADISKMNPEQYAKWRVTQGLGRKQRPVMSH